MNSRERVLAALAHKEAGRIPYTEETWFTTIERRRKEGMPGNITTEDFFGFEMGVCGADSSFRLPVKVIEETDEYIIQTNCNGITERNWKHRTSTPELIARPKWEELKGNPAGSDWARVKTNSGGKLFFPLTETYHR
jgi:hypothetical protein